jgi:zeta-carotene desaturase
MPPVPKIGIVGGGLAGLAAGAALAEAGFGVTVLERKPFVGGRASSFEHPGTGEVVDNCQHVLLGCCTSLRDFYGRIGAGELIRWYDRLTFIEPGGRQSTMGASWLPAPFHAMPSFLAAASLSCRDKLAIARAMGALLRGLPQDNGRPFLDWLRRRRQTPGAIEHFWKVVLVSALNEDLERVSLPAAALVFRESFLKSAEGGRMGVPRVPLTELYSRAADFISAHNGAVELRATVERLEAVDGLAPDAPGARLVVNGEPRIFDYAVLAVPFHALPRLLPASPEAEGIQRQVAGLQTSPITGVHLWFDREVTQLDHAVLLDRTIQWMFNKSRILDLASRQSPTAGPVRAARPVGLVGPVAAGQLLESREPTAVSRQPSADSYLEVVISASRSLTEKPRQEIVDLVVRELGDFFPEVRGATLLKATVIKEVHATFSPAPGSDQCRPGPEAPWPRVFLAGDWTATGWPATMESAVRSGYLAAEAVCRAAGTPRNFLAPDLPPTGLVRLLGGGRGDQPSGSG